MALASRSEIIGVVGMTGVTAIEYQALGCGTFRAVKWGEGAR